MRPNTSPLEHLTAFAIVFATGILVAATFVAYMERVRRNAVRDHYKRTNANRIHPLNPEETEAIE